MDLVEISARDELVLLASRSLDSAADFIIPPTTPLGLEYEPADFCVPLFYRRLRLAGWLEWSMAKLALIYGMRLLPADEMEEVKDAEITLKSGKKAHVTMHLIEGGEDEIRRQLMQSLDAFFEFYPEL